MPHATQKSVSERRPPVPDIVGLDQPAMPPRRRARLPRQPRGGLSLLINVVLLGAVGYLVLLPLAILIYSSLKDSETELPFDVPGFSFGNFTRIFHSSRLAEISWNSALFVVGTVVVALIISVTLAYLFERTNLPGRRFLAPFALAPMAVPATVMAIAWVLAANPSNGPVALGIKSLTGVTIDIYSIGGMMLVAGIFGVPSMYLMIAPTFARLNMEFEEAAATAGAGWFTRTRKVVLPLTLPAISAASMLLVVVALEEFAIPAILGLPDQIFVFSSLIQASLQPPSGLANYGQASGYGVLLLILSLVMVVLYRRQIRESHRYRVVVGKSYRRTLVDLGRWRTPAAVLVGGYLFVFILVPILTLVWTSLSPFLQPINGKSAGRLTFENYGTVFTNPGMGHAVMNTLEISVATAALTTLLSLGLAMAARSGKGRWGKAMFELTFLVFGIPSVVLGAAVLFLYLYLPISVYGTIWIIIIALVTRYLPRGSRMVQTALLQLDDELEEVARVSGASTLTVERKIVLPLIAPAVWKVALWVFTHALGELPIALLLASADNKTVVVMLWEMIEDKASYPEASALAVMLLALSALSVWWVNRRGIQE